MRGMDYTPPCPICSDSMVVRQGPKIRFYGCVRYPACKGKRTLDGEVFGMDDEVPDGLDAEGEGWFHTGIAEGMSYDEAREMAFDWQRQEERDRHK